MKSKFGHLVIFSKPENLGFYEELLLFLGWSKIYQDENLLGMGSQDGAAFWFGKPIKDFVNDYDGPGVNHIAINTGTQADVDATVKFLRGKGIPALFETPRHRPEFSGSDGQTYYQVMFESPDRILFEVVYIGAKQ
jgi:catechol 2,3-dioxygenase-like lactoylglutathione lyase family enzyme